MKVNPEIALTHLMARKKQTIVTVIGVVIGIGMYIFMNSLITGINRYFDAIAFKTTPHIRIYIEDEISKPILVKDQHGFTTVIVNPKISNINKNLINPVKLVNEIKKQKDVTAVTPTITVNLFYNNGKSQVNGVSSGVHILEADAMFNIQSTMVDGDLRALLNTSNGILIGVGIADKLNLKLDDVLSITSSIGIIKSMKVVGIFKTSILETDNRKSYMNLAAAQELLQQGPGYVTDINVNIKTPAKVEQYVTVMKDLTGYAIEDWKVGNELATTGRKVRTIMFMGISLAILLVAASGIYNIINMTISQKLNDIAILKATGFSGKDVIKIFVGEALIMGVIGTFAGFLLSIGLIIPLSHIYIGGDIGNFPIQFELLVSVEGIIIGILITLAAGYIPARKAAKTDPIAIFRR